MAFCENCGKELGPDEVCDCQKTQAGEGSNAETETKTQAEAASGTETAAAGTDTAPATETAAAGTDTAPATETAAAGTDTTPVTGTAATDAGTTPYGQTAAFGTGAGDKPAKKTPVALIAGVAVAAVVVLAVLIASLMGSGSYKTPVKDFVNLINKRSTDIYAYQKLSDPLSADLTKNLYNILKKNDDIKDGFADLKEGMSDFYEDIKGFKITKCDFTAAKEMKKKDLRDIQDRIGLDKDDLEELLEDISDMDKGDYEDMADMFDISVADAKKMVKEVKAYYQARRKIKVTKGYEVTVRFYAKYDGDEDKTGKIDVKVIKVNGKWRIYNTNDLLRQMEFDKDLSDVDFSDLNRLIRSFDLSYIY